MVNEGIRRYPRINTDLQAQIIYAGDMETKIPADIYELGQGGCLLKSRAFINVGRVVLLEITLPAETIRVVAKVLYEFKWQEDIFAGFSFAASDEGAPQPLLDYIEERLPEFESKGAETAS